MKGLLIGAGECGNRIVNEFFAARGIFNKGVHKVKKDYLVPLLLNTAEADLTAADFVDRKYKMLLGGSVTHGHGLGGDNALSYKIAMNESVNVVERIRNLDAADVHAFFLIAGLGGGTGSGVIPVLAPKLRETFIGTPVIAIGVLPAPSEGELASFNAARSLMALAGNVDGFIMIDNEKFLRWGKSMHESYRIINHRLVRRLRLIAEASEGPVAGEKVLDAADILNTICGTARIAAQVGEDVMSGGGRAGGPLAAELSTIGYASEQLPQWPIVGLRRKTNPMWRARRILALTKTALTEALIDANFENATQSLILVVGPQDEIDMEGFVAARSWLSKLSNGGEVRGGDYPVKSKTLEVIVAFGGLTEIPRVTQILEMGKDFTAKRPEVVKDKQERLSQLYSASADIEPLG